MDLGGELAFVPDRGSRIAFGGGQCSRQVAARQARQYGVKTR